MGRASRVVLCLLLLSRWAEAQSVDQLLSTRFDPSIRFLTIDTPHFRIHFEQGLEEAAKRVEYLAEPVYEAVTARMRWRPKRKTDLILVSNTDRTNAFTVFYPAPQIQMTVGPPNLMQGIAHYGDWLRWLLIHEFTHVVHVDRAEGIWGGLRRVMGASARPNHMQPVWFQEGIAVLAETALDTSGRGDSSTYRMMLRAAYRDGLLGKLSFGTMSSASYSSGGGWPWIHRSYLWGSVLAETMEEESAGSTARLAEAGGRQLVPGVLGPSLSSAGLPLAHAIQAEAVRRAGERAATELAILSLRPETEAVRLTHDGQNKFGLDIDPEGAELLFTSERPERDNRVVALSLTADGKVEKVRDRFFHQAGYQLSFSKSGRYIAFDDMDSYKKFNFYSDLFLHDLDKGAAVLRSSGLRGRDPDIHPDGRNLVYVGSDGINSEIAMCDSGFGNFRSLYVAPNSERLAEPRFSPEGDRLVFIEHLSATGGERLMLLDADGSIRALTDGGSVDRDPVWSPDGRFVLFSSDRPGTPQIFGLEVSTGALKQITHRYGGAFWPRPDPKGRFLFFLDYSAAGYDVARMPWSPELWWAPDRTIWLPSKEEAPGPGSVGPVTASNDAVFAPVPYRSWKYLKPTYLAPAFALRHEGSLFGFQSGSVDPAYHRLYRTRLLWGGGIGTPQGEVFFYDGSRPTAWVFAASHDRMLVQHAQTLDLLTADFSLYTQPGSQRTYSSLQLGLAAQRYSNAGVVQYLAGPVIKFEGDSLLAQPNDLVAETGRRVSLQGTLSARRDDSPLVSLRGSAERPFRLRFLGAHAVLTFSGALGRVWQGSGAEYLLHAGGEESFPFSQKSSFQIPAFEPNEFAGQRIGTLTARLSKPVITLQRGFATWPLYVGRLGLGARVDFASVKRRDIESGFQSFGLDVLLETEFTRRLPVLWTLSWYRGKGPGVARERWVLNAKLRR